VNLIQILDMERELNLNFGHGAWT